jgi:hypothetical protein
MMRRGRSGLEDETLQMARLLCMHRQRSEGRIAVMRGGRCCRLYCVRARAEKGSGRMEPNSDLRSQQCRATQESRSENNNARRATAHVCAPDALHVAAGSLTCLISEARQRSEGKRGCSREATLVRTGARCVERSDHVGAYIRRPNCCCRDAGRWRECVAAQERTDGRGCERSGSEQQHRASTGRAQRRGALGREEACGLLGLAERNCIIR